jgi:glycosyltransferase involved in cell wall biosynthesis
MFGFNVIGHLSGNLGLGVLARNVVRLLRDKGLPVAALDIDPGLGRGGHDLGLADIMVGAPQNLPHAINLFVLPPPTLLTLLPTLSNAILDPARLNVALPMWELPVLPRSWDIVFEFFDVVLAGSPFIQAALEFSLSNLFIIPITLPIYLPDAIPTDRAVAPTATRVTTFLTAFEPYSDPARKNPAGAIEAFRMAATVMPNARLLVKVNSTPDDKTGIRALAPLRRLSATIPAVEFQVGRHSYAEALDLYSRADVVVSLHRAEGLGLVPMEAMAMGKPVIATAWSGNMAYMSHRSACLVGYRLVPVQKDGGVYRKMLAGAPARWAEPDLHSASRWMARLAGDARLRERMGSAASAQIADYQRRAFEAAFIDELQQIFANRQTLCRPPGNRKMQLERIRALPVPWKDKLSLTLRKLRGALHT